MAHPKMQVYVCLLVSIVSCSQVNKKEDQSSTINRRILVTEKGNELRAQVYGENVFRLAVFNGNSIWEEKENGSTASAIEAYSFLFEKISDNPEKYMYEEPLKLKLIQDIRLKFEYQEQGNHLDPTLGVGNINKITQESSFGLNASINQMQGIENYKNDLKQRLKDMFKDFRSAIENPQQNFQKIFDIYPNLNQEYLLSQFQQAKTIFLEHQEVYKKYIENLKKDNSFLSSDDDSEDGELINMPEDQLNFEPYQLFQMQNIIRTHTDMSLELKKACIELLLFKYELDTENLFQQQIDVNIPEVVQKRQNQFLRILAILITDLERMHPYIDFNCRTFAVFILNKELIRRNMRASIMEDPNVFDYMTINEIIEEIKIGQKNFEKLIQDGKLHDNDPSDYDMIMNFQPIINVSYVFCNESSQDIWANNVHVSLSLIRQLELVPNSVKNLNQIKDKIYQVIISHKVFKFMLISFNNINILPTNKNLQQQSTIADIIDKSIKNSFKCQKESDAKDFTQALESLKQIIEETQQEMRYKHRFPQNNNGNNLRLII